MSLNPAKAQGFEKISVRIILFCNDSITLPLVRIFKTSLSQSVFLMHGKLPA